MRELYDRAMMRSVEGLQALLAVDDSDNNC